MLHPELLSKHILKLATSILLVLLKMTVPRTFCADIRSLRGLNMIKWVNVGSSCEYEFFADCSFFMQIIIFILATRVSLFQSSISENQVVVEIQNDQSLRQ